jgi:ABC-2 type transport system permease protein
METNSTTSSPTFQKFRSPKTVIARFVAKRSLRSAAVWAFIIGAYTASKVIGYVKAYPTKVDQLGFAHSLGSNSGLSALLGAPHDLTTIGGYANWVTLGFIALVGSTWAFLLATKYFRGEEESGRSELLLTGQTTEKQAAISTLLGLSANLVLLYVIVAILFIAIGTYKGVGFSAQSSLFFALASTSGAAIFLAVGAFVSQVMPTRTRASATSAGIFALSFVLRAVADTTSQHWILNITPLGWIEKLLPLVGSQPIWFLPIFGSVAVLYIATVWVAGHRDLGDSILADHDTAQPRTKFLNTPLQLALRLTRATSIGWAAAITASGLLYGSITNSVVKSLTEVRDFHKALTKIDATHRVGIATLFLGAIFLILMVVIMAYTASAIGKVREDEAEGYLDNFLVQPVARYRWLTGRILLIASTVVLICVLASLGVWAGQASQHVGLPIHTLLEAAANMIAPALLTLSISVLAFGLIPRYTTLVAYCVIGWSLLITLVASGTSISHWILDTSILHQVALAPAVSPNWAVNAVMFVLAIVFSVAGLFFFNTRDLESE